MKSILLSLFTILFLSDINAQPTLTSADIPKSGDVFNYQNAVITGVSAGSTGINQVWDYSGLIDASTTLTQSFLTPAQTPYAALFPTSNLVLSSSANIYDYIKTSTAAVQFIGLLDAMGDTGYYQLPLTFLSYPFSYGSSSASSSILALHIKGSSSILPVTHTITNVGTGYGTLTLPGNNVYNNVLQVKQTEIVTEGGFLSDTIVSIFYFEPGIDFNLLNIQTNFSGTVNSVEYLKSFSTVPLTLVSFNAQLTGSSVQLNWQTTNEINTNHFIVQKSIDGSHFTDLQQINASTASSATHSYNSDDAQPYSGENYYRLKQVDNNGNFSYSKIIQVTVNKTGAVSILPNPVHGDYFTLSTNNTKAAKVQLYVKSSDGKLILTQPINILSGLNNQLINITKLSRGTYFVIIATEDDKQTLKLIKQ